ncbi:hypothetical protein [Lysobacter gummosus]
MAPFTHVCASASMTRVSPGAFPSSTAAIRGPRICIKAASAA